MRIFVAVVQHGTFKKGADAMNLTQPAVSLHLKELESTLGITLLDKSGRSSAVTLHGKVFYLKCLEVLEQISQIRPSLDELTKKIYCIDESLSKT